MISPLCSFRVRAVIRRISVEYNHSKHVIEKNKTDNLLKNNLGQIICWHKSAFEVMPAESLVLHFEQLKEVITTRFLITKTNTNNWLYWKEIEQGLPDYHQPEQLTQLADQLTKASCVSCATGFCLFSIHFSAEQWINILIAFSVNKLMDEPASQIHHVLVRNRLNSLDIFHLT